MDGARYVWLAFANSTTSPHCSSFSTFRIISLQLALASIITKRFFMIASDILLISSQDNITQPPDYQCLKIDSSEKIPAKKILKSLFERGIYSVYIEGGAQLASSFLQQGELDILQLHLSPLVLGSGINGLDFGEIVEVADALRFEQHNYFAVGDAMMFVGEL